MNRIRGHKIVKSKTKPGLDPGLGPDPGLWTLHSGLWTPDFKKYIYINKRKGEKRYNK